MKIIKTNIKHIPDSFAQEIHMKQHPEYFKLPVKVQSQADSFFDHIIYKENNFIFIAYKKDESLGYIWFTLDDISENPFKFARRQIYIHQIVVHEKHRSKYIGTSLVKAENVGKLNRVKHYELDSWSFNSEAHEFFKRLGVEPFNTRMWRDTG